eukprot:Hpha_TRINITY_DN8257_c0_g1::TRINITY_DN8257_c0_g1_i1::g.111826::m.111826/K09586/ERP29; endoplasmic reticulum protein 29
MLCLALCSAVAVSTGAEGISPPPRGVVGVDTRALQKLVRGTDRPLFVRLRRVPSRPRSEEEARLQAQGDREWAALAALVNELGAATSLALADLSVVRGTADSPQLGLPRKYPAFRLYLPRAGRPLRFSGSITAANLADFIRQKGVWLGRPGCTQPLDDMAAAYVAAGEEEQARLTAKAEDPANWGATSDPLAARYYSAVMRRIAREGPQAATEAVQRLQRLRSNARAADVRQRCQRKLNVLASFAAAAAPSYPRGPTPRKAPVEGKATTPAAEAAAPEAPEAVAPEAVAPEASETPTEYLVPPGVAAALLVAALSATYAGGMPLARRLSPTVPHSLSTPPKRTQCTEAKPAPPPKREP